MKGNYTVNKLNTKYAYFYALFFVFLLSSRALAIETLLPMQSLSLITNSTSLLIKNPVGGLLQNPATLAQNNNREVFLTSQAYFGYSDITTGIVLPFRSIHFGIAYTQMGTNDIPIVQNTASRPTLGGYMSDVSQQLLLSGAVAIQPNFSMGAKLGYFTRSLSKTTHAILGDIGVLYSPDPRFSFGLHSQNLVAKESPDALTKSVFLTGMWSFKKGYAQLSTNFGHILPAIGVDLGSNVHLFSQLNAANAGLEGYQVGLVMRHGALGLHYTFQNILVSDLGTTQHQLGLSFRW